MTNKTQRYDWEDALIEAETMNVITTAGANFGYRIARVINWVPGDGRPSGLYWKNELAADVVGLSRSTLFRGMKALKEAGFLQEVGGNLLPVIPESQIDTKDAFDARQKALVQSHLDTKESQIDTTKSQIDTDECQIEHPYSEDTYTEDSLSEDSSSEVAPAPSLNIEDTDSSSLYEDIDDFDEEIEWDTFIPEEVPQSQIDTSNQKDEMSDREIERAVKIRADKRHWGSINRGRALERAFQLRNEFTDAYDLALAAVNQIAGEIEGEDW